MNNKYCIVIPIYKTKLNEYEILSLKQCCKILAKHHIFFVTYKNLDTSEYNKICNDFNTSFSYEYFNKLFFSDISCYNALLLSNIFYTQFKNYEYMLIYQLDAYVFRDEFEYWCKKDYDYIGAPWLGLDGSKIMPVFDKSLPVGNGGFSLRKIKTFISLHNTKMSILSFIHLFQSYYNEISSNSRKNILYFIPRFFIRPVLKILKFIFFKYSEIDNNEDVKWSSLFQKKGKIPPAMEAMKFSFENFPEYLYQLNNEELPFGCHEWYRYYNYFFYRKHMQH